MDKFFSEEILNFIRYFPCYFLLGHLSVYIKVSSTFCFVEIMFSLKFKISDQIWWGLHVDNANQVKFTKVWDRFHETNIDSSQNSNCDFRANFDHLINVNSRQKCQNGNVEKNVKLKYTSTCIIRRCFEIYAYLYLQYEKKERRIFSSVIQRELRF